MELRPGALHSARETWHFYERVFPRIERLVAVDQAVLLREYTGFDSACLWLAKVAERDRFHALGRSFVFIWQWNTRQQDKADWMAQSEVAGVELEVPLDKRKALL